MNDFVVNFEVPEGYVIDQEESTKDRIVLKKSTIYPKTWEEFCKKNPNKEGECFIDEDSIVKGYGGPQYRGEADKNLCKTKQEAEAFLALIQLKRLWYEYVDEYKDLYFHYKIYLIGTGWIVNCSNKYSLFSFPSQELAQEFLDNFKDLFIKIEPLFKNPK